VFASRDETFVPFVSSTLLLWCGLNPKLVLRVFFADLRRTPGIAGAAFDHRVARQL